VGRFIQPVIGGRYANPFIAPCRKERRAGCRRLQALFKTGQQTSLSHAVEITMWNRFISSPYAHFITAMALTLGLVLGLLAENSEKSSSAKFDASAQKAPSDATRPELASRTNHPVTTSFDRVLFPGQPGVR
jgi:hypothetical protein